MRSRVIALLVSAVLVTACQPTQTTPSTPPQTGGAAPSSQTAQPRAANQTLSLGQIGLPANLSPAASASNNQVYSAMYDTLVYVDGKGNVLPQVGTKWEMTNPTTWRFTIRTDGSFSNGDKLTADDIEFTVNTIVNEKFPEISLATNVSGAKKVDDATVDIMTKVQDASAVAGMSAFWLMPKNYYTQTGKDGFAVKPIGSGPYVLTDFRTNDVAVFKKRPQEHPFRKVVATDITIHSITEQTQMAAGLRTGDLDMVWGSLLPDIVDGMKSYTKVQYQTTNNLSGLFSQPEMKMRNTPLQDKRVRLAINYAVDKDAIAKNLYHGYAIATGQMTVPNSPAWDPAIKPIPYDPAMAKKLLAEAGYPNGFKLELGIEFTPLTANPNLAAAIQSNLRDVGIEAPVTQYELAAFLDKYYGRNGQTKGDIFLQSTGDGNGFMTQAQGLYSCENALVWWCNQQFEENMKAADKELDVAKRSVLMRKAIAGFTDDVAHLNLIVSPWFVVTGQKTGDFNWDGSLAFRVDSIYKLA